VRFRRQLLPSIDRLQAFEAAARHQSITLAAQELNLSQGAISRQILELERQLGVALFNRIRRRIELSAPGRKFLPAALRLLQQAEELVIETVTAANASTVFSVSVPHTFGSRWLIPRISSFLAIQPKLSLNILGREGPFDLAELGVDAVIHFGVPYWPKATCRHLFSEFAVPVASPTLLRRPEFVGKSGIEIIPRAPLLHLSTRPRDWNVWFEHFLTAAPGGMGHRLESISSLISAASVALGIALVPKYLVENELMSGRLVMVVPHRVV
jgi:LysR family transcriptional regulator, glycine cleavage system transcriptional activator